MMASGPPETAGGSGWSWVRLLCGAALLLWTLHLGRLARPWTPLDWVNLPFHEAGHVFLLSFGETLHFLGGTIFQLLIPCGLVAYFLLKASPFSAAACFWWLGQNFLGIAMYMADARELTLPLVGGGENDWNHLFYEWGMLGEDSVRIASGSTHAVGMAVMLAACLWMGFLALPGAGRDRLAGKLARRFPLLLNLYASEE